MAAFEEGYVDPGDVSRWLQYQASDDGTWAENSNSEDGERCMNSREKTWWVDLGRFSMVVSEYDF